MALTVPAYVAAELVRSEVPNASDALMGFDYPPVAAVSLAYPLSAIREERKDADGSLPGTPLRNKSLEVYVSECGLLTGSPLAVGTARSEEIFFARAGTKAPAGYRWSGPPARSL